MPDCIYRIHGEITDEGIKEVIGHHLSWGGPVTLLINSPGGDIQAVKRLSIYLALKGYTGMPVRTVGYGHVCSAAAVLLGCGTPGMRYLHPEAKFMLHHAADFVIARNKHVSLLASRRAVARFAPEMVPYARQINSRLEGIHAWMLGQLGRSSGLDVAAWDRLMGDGRDHFLPAETVQGLGLVDHVGVPPDLVPRLGLAAMLA